MGQIFLTKGLKDMLEENERVECDGIYIGADPQYCKSKYGPTHSLSGRQVRNTVRARHETGNGRLKTIWNAISTVNRHGILKHGTIFLSIACITQIAIECGERLFHVHDYNDAKFKKQDVEKEG